jgi:glycosyltransferase involved in cell wall biosynthesis
VGRRTERILVDCSNVDFSRQPTGVPRVVLKYIEVGYDWGRRNGIKVIPVLPSNSGVFIYRPVPGRNPPQDLLAAAKGEIGVEQRLGAELVCSLVTYVTEVTYHLLYLWAALLPLSPIKVLVKWLDLTVIQRMKRTTQRMKRFANEPFRIDPRPGDIIFTPAYWHDVDPELYRTLRASGAKIVVLVHDLLPISLDRFYPAPWCYEFKENVQAAFTYADAFFCVSNYTRSSLIEFGNRQKQKVRPVMTAYNGYEPLVERDILRGAEFAEKGSFLRRVGVERAFGDPVRPFVMVGSIEPKKGHLPTIKCFEAIWRAGHNRKLVIIGRRGWLEQPIVDAIQMSAFYGEKLYWLTDIDDFDLAHAYSCSHALIFSSFGEGFGLPMVEASFFGKPTIALDTLIAHEILGDAGLYFQNAETLIDRIIELEDPGRYEMACEAALSVSWVSWDEYTPRVFDEMAKVTTDPELLPDCVPLTVDPNGDRGRRESRDRTSPEISELARRF